MDDMINMMENILGYHPLDNSIPPEKKEKPKYKSEKKVLEFKSRPVNLA
jgi:hypothetical protein